MCIKTGFEFENAASPDFVEIGEDRSDEGREDLIYLISEQLLTLKYNITHLLTYPYSSIYTSLTNFNHHPHLNSFSISQLNSSSLSNLNHNLSTLNNYLTALLPKN